MIAVIARVLSFASSHGVLSSCTIRLRVHTHVRTCIIYVIHVASDVSRSTFLASLNARNRNRKQLKANKTEVLKIQRLLSPLNCCPQLGPSAEAYKQQYSAALFFVFLHIQGVPRVKITTSGECSLC